MSKREEEQIQEIEKEEIIEIDKKIIYVLVILLVISLLAISIYVSNKKNQEDQAEMERYQEQVKKIEQEEEKKRQEEEKKRQENEAKSVEHVIPKLAVVNRDTIFLLDEYSNILWQKNVSYNLEVETYQNYLYFIDNNQLNRLDINTLSLETIENITAKDKQFSVGENYLYFPRSSVFINLADNTKYKTNLSSGCSDYRSAYLVDNKFFCRSYPELISYDITTSIKESIDSGDIEIHQVSKSWILYHKKIDEKYEFYMYNIYSKEKKKIFVSDNSYFSFVQLFENNAYYCVNNTIYQFDGKEVTEYYTFTSTSNDYQEINNFKMLLNSRILIETYTYVPCNCDGPCVCDNYYSTLYVVNPKKGKTQEIDREIYGYPYYGLSNIYYFYE